MDDRYEGFNDYDHVYDVQVNGVFTYQNFFNYLTINKLNNNYVLLLIKVYYFK